MRTIADITAYIKNKAGAYINPATEDTVSQLVMAVTNAIDSTAYDLNAAAFSETTAITNDYELDSVELNFSTAEAKTITITSADGTILWGGDVDTTAANQGYLTTAKHFYLGFNHRGFDGGDNITVTVTQFSGAGTMDCVLRTKSGTNSLLGDPTVKITDTSNTVLHHDKLVQSMVITRTFHHLGHEGMVFIYSERFNTIANGANLDILIRMPAGNANRECHLRFTTISKANTGTLDVDVILREGITVSAVGDVKTIPSTNDATVKATGVLIYSGPTVTDIGNFKAQGAMMGEKKSTGSQDMTVPEWILAPDGASTRDYLLRVTNNSGGTVDVIHNIFFFDSGAS